MNLPRLVYLAGTQDFPSVETFYRHLEILCRTGLPWFQFREKSLPDDQWLELADRIRTLTRETGTLLTINDRIDLAILSNADGVHLGQDDLPSIRSFNKIFPSPGISPLHLGISTHNLYEVRRALLLKPDYLGVGPIFSSLTKVVGLPPRGPQALKETRSATSLPLVAIGGISPEHSRDLYQEGASSLAVSGALTSSNDPVATLRSFLSWPF
ncbi:MAG: thiamine phosphate synthase [Leptospirales bacterium]